MSTLDKGLYWQCRCLMAEAERDELKAKWAMARAAERLHAVMREAGLNPAITYEWRDDTASVTPYE